MTREAKKKKRFFLIISTYIIFVLIFEVILIFGMDDLGDRLNECGRKK